MEFKERVVDISTTESPKWANKVCGDENFHISSSHMTARVVDSRERIWLYGKDGSAAKFTLKPNMVLVNNEMVIAYFCNNNFKFFITRERDIKSGWVHPDDIPNFLWRWCEHLCKEDSIEEEIWNL